MLNTIPFKLQLWIALLMCNQQKIIQISDENTL